MFTLEGSMTSACKMRRYRDPQSVETSIDNVRKAILLTTRYKNRWGLRIFEDWQSGRENKAVICENNPFSLDLQNLQNLDTRTFVFNDGKNVKLLAHQICSRSLRQGRRAISRGYSTPNYMLVDRDIGKGGAGGSCPLALSQGGQGGGGAKGV